MEGSTKKVATTRKGKKVLEAKKPHLVEGEKKTIFFRCKKSNEEVSGFLHDIFVLKKLNSINLQKRQEIKPFEDAAALDRLCEKNDCSLFIFGSNSKKRPNNLVIGRTFENHVLDILELGLDTFSPVSSFNALNKVLVASRPAIIFQGDNFEFDPVFIRIKNLLLDFFVENIQLKKIDAKYGINSAIVITSDNQQKLYFRNYLVNLNQDGIEPNSDPSKFINLYDLEEVGPRANFSIRRHEFANEDTFKVACKQPTTPKPKHKKNISTDAVGDKRGRLFVSQADFSTLALKKRKKLRKSNKDEEVNLAGSKGEDTNKINEGEHGNNEGEENGRGRRGRDKSGGRSNKKGNSRSNSRGGKKDAQMNDENDG